MRDANDDLRTGSVGKTLRHMSYLSIVFLLSAGFLACERVEAPGTEAGSTTGGGAPAAAASTARGGLATPISDVVAAPSAADDAPRTDPSLSTRSEWEALSAELGVPVAGVARSQLRDSYTEARGERVHEALDILVARGTPVLSAIDGRLLKLFDSETGGLMVYASDPSERFILLYGHLDGYAEGLEEGMPLLRGQVIGFVGTTGNAAIDTPHLHFGILRGEPRVAWWSGTPVNPYPLLVASARR
ncbi:MAG: M23 family metallopeptidase [Gemmatimonadota bacterium]